MSSKEVPRGISRLTSFTKLRLSCLASFDGLQQLASLGHLQELSFGQVWLEAADEPEGSPGLATLSAMTHLRSLSLSNTNMAALPPEVPALTRLTAPLLSGNDFETEDSLAGVERLTALRRLSLRDCGLARVTPQLSVLTSLEHLNLEGNGLQHDFEAEDSLAGVERLAALRRLNLRQCGLAHLPPQLSGLTSLERVFLVGNGLQKLPRHSFRAR